MSWDSLTACSGMQNPGSIAPPAMLTVVAKVRVLVDRTAATYWLLSALFPSPRHGRVDSRASTWDMASAEIRSQIHVRMG